MCEIVLHGGLAQFGGPFSLSVASPAEAIRALCIQIKGFRDALKTGHYRLVRDDQDDGFHYQEETLNLGLGQAKSLHIVPEIIGAKSKGLGKAIMGIALIGAAFFFAPAAGPAFGAGAADGVAAAGFAAEAFSVGSFSVSWGQIALSGLTWGLQGISQMLAPSPPGGDVNQLEAPEQRASSLFNGPVNVAEQGQVRPVVYGEVRAGSVVISSGLDAEQL